MRCNKCIEGLISVLDDKTGGKTFLCNSCGYELNLPNSIFLGELIMHNCKLNKREEGYEEIADSFSREKELQ